MNFALLLVLVIFCCSFSDGLHHHIFGLTNVTCKKSLRNYFHHDYAVIDSDILYQWLNFPMELFHNVQNISEKCQAGYQQHIYEFYQNNLQSVKMFDASGKFPSGILSGNVNQYGDYDECMEVSTAQYCLIEMDLKKLWKGSFNKYENLVHSLYSIKDTFSDPAHRVPGFSFIKWGLCVPKSCKRDDIIEAVEQKLNVRANIREDMCQKNSEKTEKLTFGDLFARFFFVLLFLLVFTSTCLFPVFNSRTDNIVKVFFGFALQKNYNVLVSFSHNDQEIRCVHGVRALSALALLMSHKTMALLYNPYINRTYMARTQAMTWSVIGRNAILYTDCFLLVSGLLTATAIFNDMDKNNGRCNFKKRILGRLFRILPSLITIILFCTYLLPLMGSGPLWPIVINHHSKLCRKYMWRNVLLVHNYFGFEDMCLTHTHQVGIDMQLFLTTPFIVYALWKFGNAGVFGAILLAAISTILRFLAIFKYKLSYVVHFGIPVSRMFKTADYSYILPTHRATIYLLGVLLAYALRYKRNIWPISKRQCFYVWTMMLMIGFLTWFGPVNMSFQGYRYNRLVAALYGALAPITWGTAMSWMIFATENQAGGFFEYLLTWKYLQLFTKIAYAVYLVQFPVFFYNVGITRHVGEFKPTFMLPPGETTAILMMATVLTICVEMPFQNIYKIYFK